MKKGQYITLEQMLLFTIGIMITIMIYFSLVFVSEGVENLSEEDQMYEIGNLISSEISQVYLYPEDSWVIVEIPDGVSGEGYKIYVSRDGTEHNLTISLGERIVNVPLKSEYDARGMLFSTAGKIKIEKTGNKISIGRL